MLLHDLLGVHPTIPWTFLTRSLFATRQRPICGALVLLCACLLRILSADGPGDKSLEFSIAPLVAGRHVESMHATRSDHRTDCRTLLFPELDCPELHCGCSIWGSLGDPDPKDQDRSDMRYSGRALAQSDRPKPTEKNEGLEANLRGRSQEFGHVRKGTARAALEEKKIKEISSHLLGLQKDSKYV